MSLKKRNHYLHWNWSEQLTSKQHLRELTSEVFQKLVSHEHHYGLAEHDTHQHTCNTKKKRGVNISIISIIQMTYRTLFKYLCKRSSGREEDREWRLLHAWRQMFTSSKSAVLRRRKEKKKLFLLELGNFCTILHLSPYYCSRFEIENITSRNCSSAFDKIMICDRKTDLPKLSVTYQIS